MKQVLLFILAFSLWGIEAKAQTVRNWIWAKEAGGGTGQNIVADNGGNIYVSGSFTDLTVTFGSYILFNNGSSDVFVVKYNSLGNVLWAKSAGGSGNDYGNGIATDKNGNVIVSGRFMSSSIAFDSITLINPEFFLVKYDAYGNVLWAKDTAMTTYHYFGNCVATDTSGNICVTGTFSSGGGYNEIFIKKHNASGNVLWSKYSSNSNEYCIDGGIATDEVGNIYFTGKASATTNFGILWGVAGVFVVKYDPLGSPIWIKGTQSGGSGSTGTSIAVTNNGAVYVTGYFATSSISFGGNTATNAGSGTTDVLLVNFSANPPSVWSVGGIQDDQGFGITTDANENIYVTGHFRSPSISFGTSPPPITLTNAVTGSSDLFVVKYVSGFFGNVTSWAKWAGGTGDQVSSGIVTDNDNAYVTGSFGSGNAVFDKDTLITEGIFTAKLGCAPLQPETISGNTTICRNSAQTYSIAAVPGTTNYSWNLPSGWSGYSDSTSISITADSTGGTISVTANNSCGNSFPQGIYIIVNPESPTITANGSTIFCDGNSVILSSSAANSYLWSNGDTTQETTISTAGNYTVAITDADGCSAPSPSITVMINPNPPVATITQNGTWLASSSANGNQWYLNGNLIPGATGQVYIPTDTGTYGVIVTDINGCFSISAPYSYTGVGVHELLESNFFSVSPNPSSGILTLSNPKQEKTSIKIYNPLGETIYQSEEWQEVIDFSHKAKGIYFIQATIREKLYVHKILIQ